MENKNKPAYPAKIHESERLDEYKLLGLTKRELIAAMAMQGLCGPEYQASESHSNDKAERVAKQAVKLADELLKQLDHGN